MYSEGFDFNTPLSVAGYIYDRLDENSTADEDLINYLKEKIGLLERFITDFERSIIKISDTSLLKIIKTFELKFIQNLKDYQNQSSNQFNSLKSQIDSDKEWTDINQTFKSKKPRFEMEFIKFTKEYELKLEKLENSKAKNDDRKINQIQGDLINLKQKWESDANSILSKAEQFDQNRLSIIKKSLSNLAATNNTSMNNIATVSYDMKSAIENYSIENELQEFYHSNISKSGPKAKFSTSLGFTSATNFLSNSVNFSSPGLPLVVNETKSNSELPKADTDGVFTSVDPPVTKTEEVLVDEAGFSVKPEVVDDPFKVGFNDDEDSDEQYSNPKLNLTIKNGVIEDNENERKDALHSVSVLLSTHSRSGSTTSRRNIRGRTASVKGDSKMKTDVILESKESSISIPDHRATHLLASKPVGTGTDKDVVDSPLQYKTELSTNSAVGNPPNQNGLNTSTNVQPMTLDTLKIRETSLQYDSNEMLSIKSPRSPYPNSNLSLTTNIVETLNILESNGQVVRILVTGEISLTFNSIPLLKSDTKIPITLHNFQNLEKVGVNELFIENQAIPPAIDTGRYNIRLNSFIPFLRICVPVIKYQVNIHEHNQVLYTPIMVNPVWKFTGNEANLFIAYQVNSKFFSKFHTKEFKISSFVTGDGPSSTNIIISNVQTQPVATWDLDSKTLTWDLNETEEALRIETPQNLVAKIELESTSESSVLLPPPPLTINFTLSNSLLSDLEFDVQNTDSIDHNVYKSVISGTFGVKITSLE
ncbi:Muniscin C-terminal mu homology domain-containing protein [Globomyces pollinis-pini]|nr:Muniscin C-terminal mu homology domain-containing protein [Globomyces pollinis-pini]